MIEWINIRLEEQRKLVDQLLSAPKFPFDDSLRSQLPDKPGLYAISVKNAPTGEFLRAGRTKGAAGGLRQRIYQNHLMGNQHGNLRAQLVQEGRCSDIEEANRWIRENCRVQFLVIEDDQRRQWAEYFMLSLLRPNYCD